MDVQRVVRLLRRWWPVLVVGTLLAAGASYVVSKAQPKVYQATAILEVYPGLDTPSGGNNFNDIQAAWALAGADAQLIKTTVFAEAALARIQRQLHHHLDAGALVKNTTATAAPQSYLINLAVRAAGPDDAALLAQAMADAFVKADQQKRIGGLTSYLNNINRAITRSTNDLANATYRQTQLSRKGALTSADQTLNGELTYQISKDQSTLADLQAQRTIVQVQQASPGATTSVAQPAQAPPDPIAPRTSVNVLVAAVLALLALLGIAVLTDALDTRPRSAPDVAAALELPLAGTISPASPALAGAALVALHDPTSPATDEYRYLRTTLGLGTDPEHAATARTLALAGASSRSGTSTVAANLAVVTARAGTRVILVDADLRHPALHTLFVVPDAAGLATLLRDGGDPATLLQTTPVPGLRLLTAGPAAATAVDLLDSARMRAELASLGALADLVVVDTGVATLPDTAALARLADGTLLVARLGADDRTGLATAANRLRLAGTRLEGVIVTSFKGGRAPGRARRQVVTPTTPDREPAARTSPRPAK